MCYDANMGMWVARLWWMLRSFGFDDAAVLDGGWKKWTAEGRPVSAAPPAYQRATFVARPRPELIATRDDVLRAIESGGDACIVNARAFARSSSEQHLESCVAPHQVLNRQIEALPFPQPAEAVRLRLRGRLQQLFNSVQHTLLTAFSTPCSPIMCMNAVGL